MNDKECPVKLECIRSVECRKKERVGNRAESELVESGPSTKLNPLKEDSIEYDCL